MFLHKCTCSNSQSNFRCQSWQHDLGDLSDGVFMPFEILGMKNHWMPKVTNTNQGINIETVCDEFGIQPAIPGSSAAQKRKEQLEFQLPKHDFSAKYCHNLSENEEAQLDQYVQKIKRCFGQGEVNLTEDNKSTTLKTAGAKCYQGIETDQLPQPNYSTFPGGIKTSSNMDDAVNNNLEMANQFKNLTLQTSEILKCRGCGEEIGAGKMIVRAERLGSTAAWHPKCFSCKLCSQLLVDLIYFHHNNEIYCARDLALMMEIPRCHACDELILTNQFTFAENANYHLRHFACYHCDDELAGKKYIPDEKTNLPLCMVCYDQYFANKCNKCTLKIEPDENAVSYKDSHYHSQCFQCVVCLKSLIGGRFCVKHNSLLCSSECVSKLQQQM